MAAVNFTHGLFQAQDDNGRPLIGGKLYTYENGTTTPAVTYTDPTGVQPNTNPVVLDARGEARVYLLPDQLYTFVLKDANDALVWSMDGVAGAASAVDLSKLVADLAAGSGAEMVGFKQDGTGAWAYNIGQKLKAWVTPEDFGAIGDDQSHPLSERYATLEDAQEDYPFATSLTQEIDYCAIVAAINSRTFGTGMYVSGPEIWLRGGAVYVCGSNTIQLKKSVKIVGPNSGLPSTSAPALKFDDGCIGIIVHRFNTIDDTVEAVPTTAGDGSVLEGFRLIGGRVGTNYDGTSHGIWLRARAVISRLFIDAFGGNGIHIVAASNGGPSTIGNANNWRVDTVRIQRCYNGLFVNGADVNAGLATAVDASNNMGWGIWDSSFLGNTYVAPHTQSNGINVLSRVHYNGNRYACVRSAESGSPNKGLAPDLNPDHWRLVGAGGTSATYQEWDPNIEYKEGGGYKSDGANNQSYWYGVYQEGGQYSELAPRNIVIGANFGNLGAGLTNNNRAVFMYGSNGGLTLSNRELTIAQPSPYNNWPTALTFTYGEPGNATIFSVAGASIGTSFPIRLHIRTDGTLTLDRANSQRIFSIPMDQSGAVYGRPTATASVARMMIPELFLERGSSPANARSITFVTAVPTSGECARGDILFNRNATAGQSMGWQVVVGGVFGSTAEVKALPAIAA